MNNAESRTITKSPITLNMEKGIYSAEYQKAGTLSVELRQAVTTVSVYPSKKTSNEMAGGLFTNDAFGFEKQTFESTENRVAWVPVPAAYTMEQVLAAVAKCIADGGEIYRVLSLHPIISTDQQYAIDKGLKTLDDFANQQAMRFPENPATTADGTANTLILDDNGNVQYRKTFFWPTKRADEDKRDAKNVYVSTELKAELNGAASFAGQEVN